MGHFDEYEDRLGHCQQPVEDHTYRVISFRRCQNQFRWLLRLRWKTTGKEQEMKLCTRHKNEFVKYADKNDYEILSIEELPREKKN